MDASKIIRQMHDRYAACTTYQDAGFVRMPWLSFGAELKFKTYLLRPNKFRLDWQHYKSGKSGASGSVWTDGNDVYARSINGKKEKSQRKTLKEAIALAAEASAGTSIAIPTLLFPIGQKSSLAELKKVYLVADDSNPTCFCIRGCIEQDDDTQLWIDKNTLVLKRMRAGIGQKIRQPFEFALDLVGMRVGSPINLSGLFDYTMSQHSREDRVYEDVTFDGKISEELFNASQR